MYRCTKEGQRAEVLPQKIPAAVPGERADGGALRSFPLDAGAHQPEVVLGTDDDELNINHEGCVVRLFRMIMKRRDSPPGRA